MKNLTEILSKPEVQSFLLLILYSLWEYLLGKTNKIKPNSTIELIFWILAKLFTRKEKEQMDIGNIAIGNVGAVDFKIVEGKFTVMGNVGAPNVGTTLNVGLTTDTDILLDFIAKAIPGTFDDAVIAVAKVALKQVK